MGILLSSLWTYSNVESFSHTAKWLAHTREVATVTEQLSWAISRANSSSRGFWVSGDPQFRDNLEHAISRIDNRLAKLRELTVDNPWQLEKLGILQEHVDGAATQLRQFTTTSREAISTDSDKEVSMLRAAMSAMTPIESALAEIKEHEEELLDQRTTQFERRLNQTRANLLFSSLLSVALVSLAFFVLRQHWSSVQKSVEDIAILTREKSSLSRYNARLLESTSEGIYGIDVLGRCTFMNSAAAQLLGGKTTDFLGVNLHQAIHHTRNDGEVYREEECPISVSAKQGESCFVDTEVFWKSDGESFAVEYTSSPIKDGNHIEGAVVTFKDVTEKRKAQLELQQAKDAAETANESKSQFLANMSHELRTPLNAVIMYSELLCEEAEEQNVPDFIPDLNRIRSAGKHLLELVNGVLDLSKIDAGKMEIFAEEIDLRAMVDEVVSTMTPLIEKNRNVLTTSIDDSLETMTGDLTKLRQVLFNLISNASKFTEDGEIQLIVSRPIDTSKICFSVADSGIGMTDEQISRLFQPFMQADASTTRKYGGTGLGLAIIKRFSELMQGEVSVQSTPGSGTTFEVTLPLAFDTDASSTTVVPRIVTSDLNFVREAFTNDTKVFESDRPKVLIIDDDPVVIDIVRRILTSEGLETIAAIDGEQGMRLAEQLHPALIILDVDLPKIDGWSVLVTLKSDELLSDIPIIMQSGNDNKELGFMLGASDYLVKPIDRSRLVKIMRRHVLHEGATILIVEDDESIQRALSRSLRKEGWKVKLASNGAEALVAVDKERPTAIILDLTMPVMDGLEFLEILRANPAWNDIPVVVSTSKDLTADDRQRLKGTVQRVVAKGSITRDGLVDEVRKIVKSHVEVK